ncbi:MAG: hypothetical protein M0C28_18010 [Candidatus Moduliflexus flocculans]|nr:hypothetical protein [Candidatus Moduliflexus flocculans]
MNDVSAVPERAVRLLRDDHRRRSTRRRPSRSRRSRRPTGRGSPWRSRTRTARSCRGGGSPGRPEAPTSTRSRTSSSPGATRSPGPSPSRTASRSRRARAKWRWRSDHLRWFAEEAPPRLRPRRPEPGRRQAAPGHQDADGRRRRDQPVELPARARGAQGGARAGGRVHGRAQARDADAGLRGAAGRVRARRGRAPRRVPGHRGPVRGVRRGAAGEPAVPQDHVHRLDRGRPGADPRRGRVGEAAVARARRPRAGAGLRGRRPRRRRGRRDGGEVPQHRPVVHRGQPRAGRAPDLRAVPRGLRREGAQPQGGRRPRTGRGHRPAVRRGGRRQGHRACRGRGRRRRAPACAAAGGSPAARGSSSSRRSWPTSLRRARACARRRSRPSRRCARSTARKRRSTLANASIYGLSAYAFTHEPGSRVPADGGPRGRDDRHQRRRALDQPVPVRRREAERLGTRARHRGPRRVPRDQARLARHARVSDARRRRLPLTCAPWGRAR